MSFQEILAELPKLKPHELQQIKERLDEQLIKEPKAPAKPLSDALLEYAGVAEGLPSDMAENHDHYLYGVPKRQQ